MKRINRIIQKPHVFICTILSTATIALAGGTAEPVAPSNPGRPEVINIRETSGNLTYLAPLNDGGSPITKYVIEYREKWEWEWEYKGISKTLEYPFHIAKGTRAQFRVTAENEVGISKPSFPCNPITFRDPFNR